tara:strand:+ start:16268 stop:16720 length:453 start_codon:yes stop_codon:yes gene_type:complete
MTLKEVRSLLNNLADDHKQINDFGWGDVWELGESQSIVYPLMYCTIQNSNVTGKVFNLSLSILFCDLVFGDNKNEDDVISDQMLICQDIIAQLRSDTFEFTLGNSVNVNFFNERLSDLVAGVQANITLALPYVADRCAVPSDFPLIDAGQ